MSYCVQCGVELGKGESRCPLCGTDVILPPGSEEAAGQRPLPPDRDEFTNQMNRALWFRLISIVLLTPALISLTLNLLLDSKLTWSMIVMGSLATVWVVFVSPLLFQRRMFLLWIVVDIFAVSGLLYLIELSSVRTGWFRPLAFPLAVWTGALVLILFKLIERGVLKGLEIVSGVFAAVGALSLLLDGLTALYLHGGFRLSWSLIVIITCASVAAIFALVQRQKRLTDRLERWFHF